MACSSLNLATCIFVVAILLAMTTSKHVAADSGTATFYTQYVPSKCFGFDRSKFPAGDKFAAASDTVWDGGAACGKKFSVKCTAGTTAGVDQPCRTGSITVTIVDHCPAPNCRGTLDLSADAFAAIADPNEGKIIIDFSPIH